LTRVSYNTP